MLIVFKLNRYFGYGLKMCICFEYYPQFIVCIFFHKFSLVVLRHLLLSKYTEISTRSFATGPDGNALSNK